MSADNDADIQRTKASHEGDAPTRVVRWEELSGLIRNKRAAERLTLDQAARESGVSSATLSRWERQWEGRRTPRAGQHRERSQPEPDMRTLAAIARWLNVSLDRIVGVNVAQPDQCVVHREGDSTPDIVAAHLRADKKIDTATAQALERMFRSIYEEFAGRRASAAPDQASASPGAEPILVDPGDAGTPSDSD